MEEVSGKFEKIEEKLVPKLIMKYTITDVKFLYYTILFSKMCLKIDIKISVL